MSNTPNPNHGDQPATHDAARSLVQSLIRRPYSEPFSAEQILAEYPSLKQYPTCIVDLAYEEYCRARESGRNVPATEFVKAFTGVEQSLYRVIEFDQILHDQPGLIEGIPDDRWPDVGSQFRGFELVQQIGSGALSRVFVARQLEMGSRPVVVKVCVRSEREAVLLGTLEHDHIAKVHSIHTDPNTGLGAICMPFETRVTMHHLAEEITRTATTCSAKRRLTANDVAALVTRLNRAETGIIPATPREILLSAAFHRDDLLDTIVKRWAIQLSTALHHAHLKEVLHCDVKPGNVLLLPNLSSQLLDFNLATSAADPLRLFGGTLPFMASEQLQLLLESTAAAEAAAANDGESTVTDVRLEVLSETTDSQPTADKSEQHTEHLDRITVATDIYGLCATLWYIVMDEPPFGVTVDSQSRIDAANTMLFRQRRGLSPEQIRRISAVLSRPFVRLLVRGLHHDPAQRWESAEEFCQEVQRITRAKATEPTAHRRLRNLSIAILATIGIAILTLVPVISQKNNAVVPTAGGTGAGSSQPSGDVVRIRAEIRQLISQRQYAEARQKLAEDTTADHELQFLDLYCQTCLMPTLEMTLSIGTLPGGTRMHQYLDPESEQEWLNLAEKWNRLNLPEPFAAAAQYNLGIVHTELSQLDSALAAFRRSRQTMSKDHVPDFCDLVVQIGDQQAMKSFDNSALLMQLATLVSQRGSRGQLIAYLLLSRAEIDGSNSTQGNYEQLVLLWRFLRQHAGKQIEPEAVSLLTTHQLVFNHAELRKEMLNNSLNQPTALTNPVPLDTVLMMPSKPSVEHQIAADL